MEMRHPRKYLYTVVDGKLWVRLKYSGADLFCLLHDGVPFAFIKGPWGEDAWIEVEVLLDWLRREKELTFGPERDFYTKLIAVYEDVLNDFKKCVERFKSLQERGVKVESPSL